MTMMIGAFRTGSGHADRVSLFVGTSEIGAETGSPVTPRIRRRVGHHLRVTDARVLRDGLIARDKFEDGHSKASDERTLLN